ncbi:hypothetical protein GLOIN_2v1475229 [Rhizophagus clarus]|uniref:Uncharacterized protein n=1 Tax=Rhizophagus clarus TaxID=94130 RepID=A0A8H3LZT2_9GLOM|nr:hypothetical protein GLOIN_2v1475229 [Rhizophagus clarus]
MELETIVNRVEDKGKFVKQYYYDTFSVSKLQLCFTRGINIVKLYYMENGLEVASKKFDEIEKIILLEFIYSDEKLLIIGECPKEGILLIIWDLYDTGKYFVLNNLKDFPITIKENIGTRLARTSGNILRIGDDGSVSSIFKIIEKKKKEIKETVTETIQLIVGRSTVQIWHQINDVSKLKREKELLPNKGEPFLEYIWTNRILVDQEREDTRLQVDEFRYGSNDELHDKLCDFSLKVHWKSAIEDNIENLEKNDHEIISEGDEEIDENSIKVDDQWKEDVNMEKREEGDKIDKRKTTNKFIKREKVIKRKDIIEKFHAIRHACKALEHLNKRYKSKYLANNYIRVHEFILFGDDELATENKTIYEEIEPGNIMELAIYHCKGRELKDTIIVAYFLEYYSSHAKDCASWMSSVSKALPLLFKYNYDDYALKLFYKECFADHNHFSAHDPGNPINMSVMIGFGIYLKRVMKNYH